MTELVIAPQTQAAAAPAEVALPTRISRDLVTQCVVLALQEYGHEARTEAVIAAKAFQERLMDAILLALPDKRVEEIRSKLTPEEFSMLTGLVDTQCPVQEIQASAFHYMTSTAGTKFPKVLGYDVGGTAWNSYIRSVFSNLVDYSRISVDKVGKLRTIEYGLHQQPVYKGDTFRNLPAPILLPSQQSRTHLPGTLLYRFSHVNMAGGYGSTAPRGTFRLTVNINTIGTHIRSQPNFNIREEEIPLRDLLLEMDTYAREVLLPKLNLDDMRAVASSVINSMPINLSTKKAIGEAPWLERLIKKTTLPNWGNKDYLNDLYQS